MTIINNERLWFGIGTELLLGIAFIFILYFIFTSGKIRKDYLSKKSFSKSSLWISLILLIISMFFVYFGMISNAIIKF
ncbi:hypothetical protein [Enterococcus phoeniculicola]|uniref:Uncharacterized protein n=1 Tax=Enterococcus phoeniculicola ATCC BAA-412 TaxID=1158610 RepID=R3WWZ0_9ENTE|nr:hypothetical protein [Enterococcus phoeniculicola]EOL46295.1 hypothetical protein UC3_01101 [Enterococcus phoeniculicola ATCC BAA-412]EOT76860.1 hypothetical protein I589_01821 [Enterococcus phoeniculicola ATCC BAA-412]